VAFLNPVADIDREASFVGFASTGKAAILLITVFSPVFLQE
jgi:hypothetical protein